MVHFQSFCQKCRKNGAFPFTFFAKRQSAFGERGISVHFSALFCILYEESNLLVSAKTFLRP